MWAKRRSLQHSDFNKKIRSVFRCLLKINNKNLSNSSIIFFSIRVNFLNDMQQNYLAIKISRIHFRTLYDTIMLSVALHRPCENVILPFYKLSLCNCFNYFFFSKNSYSASDYRCVLCCLDKQPFLITYYGSILSTQYFWQHNEQERNDNELV